MSNHLLDLNGLTVYSKNIAKLYTKGKSKTITIPASNWTDGDTFIEDSFFINEDRYNYFVDATKNSKTEYSTCGVEADDVPFNGVMTFKAIKDPTKDLEINVLRLEV